MTGIPAFICIVTLAHFCPGFFSGIPTCGQLVLRCPVHLSLSFVTLILLKFWWLVWKSRFGFVACFLRSSFRQCFLTACEVAGLDHPKLNTWLLHSAASLLAALWELPVPSFSYIHPLFHPCRCPIECYFPSVQEASSLKPRHWQQFGCWQAG